MLVLRIIRILFGYLYMINKFMVFILFFCIFGITKADDFDSPFYPDLQFTENVLVAGSKVPINKTVLLRSVSAIAKENGKCEVLRPESRCSL